MWLGISEVIVATRILCYLTDSAAWLQIFSSVPADTILCVWQLSYLLNTKCFADFENLKIFCIVLEQQTHWWWVMCVWDEGDVSLALYSLHSTPAPQIDIWSVVPVTPWIILFSPKPIKWDSVSMTWCGFYFIFILFFCGWLPEKILFFQNSRVKETRNNTINTVFCKLVEKSRGCCMFGGMRARKRKRIIKGGSILYACEN